MRKILLIISFFVYILGCDNKSQKNIKISTLEDFDNENIMIGAPLGDASMFIAQKKFKKAKLDIFNTLADGYASVKYNKSHGFAFARYSLDYAALQNPDLVVMPEVMGNAKIVVGAPKKNAELIKKINSFIKQYRADGTYLEMRKRWLESIDHEMPKIPLAKNPKIHLRIGTEAINEPISYYGKNSEIIGFDIEFAKRVAYFLDASFEIISLNYGALITSTESGKIDLLICGLHGSKEREEKMVISDCYLDSDIAMIVNKKNYFPNDIVKNIENIHDLKNKKIGILTGSTFAETLNSSIKEYEPIYFNNFTDQLEAVRIGKIDAMAANEPNALVTVAKNPKFKMLPVFFTEKYAYTINKEKEFLAKKIDAVIKDLAEDGTLERIKEKWCNSNEDLHVLPNIEYSGENGTLKFGTCHSIGEPMLYMKNGQIVGYEIEIAMIIAQRLGYKFESNNYDFASLIPAVISGKIDLAMACITITAERKKSIYFTEPHYVGGVTAIVLDRNYQENRDSFFNDLKASFKRTFLIEDRWKLIFKGLWVTIVISVFSLLFGTILASIICTMRRSANKFYNLVSKIFIRTIQGMPILVLLMILYYIVFGSWDVDAIIIAIIGFSANFAAYASEMFRTGIDAVDKGQIEAAQSMGFNKTQTFTKIILPQAAKHILPVFKGEFISMVKMTSVVGYIAIQDLTKMTDIIRSRTYEAFFPLLVTALIYFIITYAFILILNMVENRINPQFRKRIVKGVKI